jgi:hypothetical protein
MQYYRPSACVIAQQYSSATFVSLPFHYRKENFSARFKKICIFFICLNLRKSETAYLEIVSVRGGL